MTSNQFPQGWNEKKVRDVLSFYEQQSETEAVAEDEAAFVSTDNQSEVTMMQVPTALVPKFWELIAQFTSS